MLPQYKTYGAAPANTAARVTLWTNTHFLTASLHSC